MKITIHGPYEATYDYDLTSSNDGQTWGQFTQKFIETKLLHPPVLLKLLTSIHPVNRMTHYRFRYGDGNATLIRVTWSEEGLNCSVDVIDNNIVSVSVGGGIVEANVTLQPQGTKSPLHEHSNDDLARLVISSSFTSSSSSAKLPKKIGLKLYIEKVAVPQAEGALFPFPLTQLPFPIDDSKTSVLTVKEHDQFEGVIDKYSIETLTLEKQQQQVVNGVASAAAAAGGATGAASTATSASTSKAASLGTKRKATAAKDNTAGGDASSGEGGAGTTTTSAKKRKSKKAAAAAAKKAPTEKKKTPAEEEPPAKKKTAKGKKGGDENINSEETDNAEGVEEEGEKVKRPPNSYMKFGSDVRSKIKEENPGIKVTDVAKKIGALWRELSADKRKEYDDAAKAELEKFKEEHPNHKNKSRKKKKKAKKGEGEENVAAGSDNEGGGSEDDAVVAEVVEADEDKEVGVEDAKDKPKRPVNAYIRFSNEIRAQIKKDNPDAKPKEIITKIAEAYRALDDDQKKKYTDAAKADMAKFKEEHPSPLKNMTKNQKKKAKKNKKAAAEGGDGDDGKKMDEPEQKQPANKKAKVADGEKKDEPKQKQSAKKKAATPAKNNVIKVPTGSSPKKESAKKSNGGTAKKRSLSEDLSKHPGEPAEGCPEGWTTKSQPRLAGDRADKFWFSPANKFQFRSKKQVLKFDEEVKKANGDEAAAMDVFKAETKLESAKKKKKKRKSVGDSGSSKKKKANGGKNNKVPVVTQDDGSQGSSEMPDSWNA